MYLMHNCICVCVCLWMHVFGAKELRIITYQSWMLVVSMCGIIILILILVVSFLTLITIMFFYYNQEFLEDLAF